MRQVYIHLISDTKQILQDNYMFIKIHSEQKEGWRLDRAAIII